MRALYPGSFDPITNGHIDIIGQAVKLFDEVVIGIAYNPKKKSLFTTGERLDIIQQSLPQSIMPKITIGWYEGITLDYAHSMDIDILIRGLRAISDFESEFQIALFNRKNIGEDQHGGINTVFLIPEEHNVYLSSSAIKEIVQMGGNVHNFVPSVVEKYLIEKFERRKK